MLCQDKVLNEGARRCSSSNWRSIWWLGQDSAGIALPSVVSPVHPLTFATAIFDGLHAWQKHYIAHARERSPLTVGLEIPCHYDQCSSAGFGADKYKLQHASTAWHVKGRFHAASVVLASHHSEFSQNRSDPHLAARTSQGGWHSAGIVSAVPGLKVHLLNGCSGWPTTRHEEGDIKGQILYTPLLLAALLVVWAEPCSIGHQNLHMLRSNPASTVLLSWEMNEVPTGK